ncbi:hypothetical protein TOI97_05430 [Denitrificimonas sp. JX-1]|uniref:Transcriptional regulator SutA RNAP-binding domain-containing protein n=1 Tax=Denitrificimonas halotolerans TaxID=3098930 RepID=A0ABU5GTR0_9GAMM|nr:hypothetical protein [Denitrificimonas sp. JX-1]MDY7219013.1 hypothetical protein [Denitrificimonas sp. JX-1]
MPNTRIKGSNQRRTVQMAQKSSDDLQAQIAQFLGAGGVIEEIPQGLSGQPFIPYSKKADTTK